MPRELRPPSGGAAPPASADLGDGEIVHLSPLAHEISRLFQAEHPEEAERYGDAAFAWCVHDNQWLLGWAAQDLEIGGGYFEKQVRWLASLLRARGYPIPRLVRDLEIAADVVGRGGEGSQKVARKLRDGAEALRQS